MFTFKSKAAKLKRCFTFADRQDLENRFAYAAAYAKDTYNSSFGMAFSDYEQLCLDNCGRHLYRQLMAEAKKRKVTLSSETEIGEGLHLGDVLCDHRNGAKRMHQCIALREYLGKLTGTAWAACVAWLAGFSRSEIARHLNIARTTFDRLFGKVFAGLLQEVAI